MSPKAKSTWQKLVFFTANYTGTNQSLIPSTNVMQLTLTLKMSTAQIVETSVTVNTSSIQGLRSLRTIMLHLLRDGPLENLWGGGRSTKKIFAQGKIK